MTEIPIKLHGGMMPVRKSDYAAAYDVFVPEDYELKKDRQIVPLGFSIALPEWWKANMRPRSGMSVKGMEAEVRTVYRMFTGEEYTSTEKMRVDADVMLGLVDSDYRDEVGVIIRVWSLDYTAPQKHEFDTIVENHIVLTRGTRIAQMEICGGTHTLVQTDTIDRNIDRGGGFGHTGT